LLSVAGSSGSGSGSGSSGSSSVGSSVALSNAGSARGPERRGDAPRVDLELLDGAGAERVAGRDQDLGFGRIAASETEVPNLFADLVRSG
jgi:hypothetical protein